MKKILCFLLFASLLTGCGKNPKPNDEIQKTEQIPDGYKPGPTIHDDPVAVFKTMVTLTITWGQANLFASKRGDYWLWQIIGGIILGLFGVFVYGLIKESKWVPNLSSEAKGLLAGFMLAAALISFKWQSAAIKWNNDIKITKERYDQAIEEAGSTRPIWDSMEKNNRLSWGPYNLYK